MGHELTGRVTEAGPEVAEFEVGDLVISPFSASCGRCPRCSGRLSARCDESALFGWVEGGRGLEGAQAERVRVPLADGTLVRRPSEFGAKESILVGDVVSTGYYALHRRPPSPGDIVAVVGLGAVGLSAVLFAREAGATVLALDPVVERLTRAESWGAIPIEVDRGHAIEGVAESVLRHPSLDGRRPMIVVEAVGSPDASRLAYGIVEPGGLLSVAGVHTSPHMAISPAEAYDKNLTIAMGRCPVRSILPEVIETVIDRALPIVDLITNEYPLEAAADAYRIFASRQSGVIKGVFRP